MLILITAFALFVLAFDFLKLIISFKEQYLLAALMLLRIKNTLDLKRTPNIERKTINFYSHKCHVVGIKVEYKWMANRYALMSAYIEGKIVTLIAKKIDHNCWERNCDIYHSNGRLTVSQKGLNPIELKLINQKKPKNLMDICSQVSKESYKNYFKTMLYLYGVDYKEKSFFL